MAYPGGFAWGDRQGAVVDVQPDLFSHELPRDLLTV